MSFPRKPSTSKSGRLTRQAHVNSSGGAHSHDTPASSDSLLQALNPRSTLLLRAELPKPMSRLPEIRLEGGPSGNGSKGQVGQVKPQKSCESYDSTASGMSWSSSQSTMAAGGAHCNSPSVSNNPSFASYEEDEESLERASRQPIIRITSTPGALHKAQYYPRCENVARAASRHLRTGRSMEENAPSELSRGEIEETKETIHVEGAEETKEASTQAETDYFDSVFDEQKTQPGEGLEPSPAVRGSTNKKSFRRFWKMAYMAIRSEAANKDANSKFGVSKKKSESEEIEEGEVDPVYQLLKSAATQRHLSMKSSTSSASYELARRPTRHSSCSQPSFAPKMEKSQPP